MPTECVTLVRGRRMRVTRVDGCGQPVFGPDSVVVSKGFIRVQYTANVEEGEVISQTNAAGELCISETPVPRFLGYGVQVDFCGVDPAMIHLFTGMPIVKDRRTPTPFDVGFRMNTGISLDDSGFALELWSDVPRASCGEAGSAAFGYFLNPFLKGGVLGDFSVENAAINFSITGAQTKDGSGWDVGPYNVVRDAANLPAPLATPIDLQDHLNFEVTTVAPPTDLCGSQALGVEATGATAGTPGTYTPANSYGPADLADLIANPITATPLTAWTTGQHIVLRDGSFAHWNATNWVAGPA